MSFILKVFICRYYIIRKKDKTKRRQKHININNNENIAIATTKQLNIELADIIHEYAKMCLCRKILVSGKEIM